MYPNIRSIQIHFLDVSSNANIEHSLGLPDGSHSCDTVVTNGKLYSAEDRFH